MKKRGPDVNFKIIRIRGKRGSCSETEKIVAVGDQTIKLNTMTFLTCFEEESRQTDIGNHTTKKNIGQIALYLYSSTSDLPISGPHLEEFMKVMFILQTLVMKRFDQGGQSFYRTQAWKVWGLTTKKFYKKREKNYAWALRQIKHYFCLTVHYLCKACRKDHYKID